MQFGGIGAITAYSVNILEHTEKMEYKSAVYFTSVYALTRLIFNALNMTLMDKIGKKKILVFSYINQSIVLLLMGLFSHLEIKGSQ